MIITHKLLELYREGVDLGLDIKLNLWTKDGEEFSHFLDFLDPSTGEGEETEV